MYHQLAPSFIRWKKKIHYYIDIFLSSVFQGCIFIVFSNWSVPYRITHKYNYTPRRGKTLFVSVQIFQPILQGVFTTFIIAYITTVKLACRRIGKHMEVKAEG